MKKQLTVFLFLFSCFSCFDPPKKETKPYQPPPTSIYERGPFVVKNFHQSTGFHNGYVWCEIQINGKLWQPFQRPFKHCSFSLKDPSTALSLVAHDGVNNGLWLLRVIDQKEYLDKLDADPMLDGRWSFDGSAYVHGHDVYDLMVYKNWKLPPYSGDFIDFSPDRSTVLSELYKGAGIYSYYLADLKKEKITPLNFSKDKWDKCMNKGDEKGRKPIDVAQEMAKKRNMGN